MLRRLLLLVLGVGLVAATDRADNPDAPIRVQDYKKPIRVACVGDSITQGFGWKNPNSYPSQLGRMLGHDWKVRNFGVSGRTLLKQGDYPYWKEKAFHQAQAFKPNVVIIMLGTNDTKPQNWKHKEAFAQNYKELVETFEHLPSKPRVFVCLPPPVPGTGNYGINEAAIQEEIPMLRQVAKHTDAGIINMYVALEKTPELLPDRVHPNAKGYRRMAAAAYQVLTGKKYEGHRTKERSGAAR